MGKENKLPQKIGEDKDTIWRRTAPHHQSWQQQVLTITSRTDNGAVYNFARTDSTRKPETLRELNGQAATSPSSVEIDTFLTTVDEEIAEEMFGAARRDKS